jgi:hypothetical protein
MAKAEKKKPAKQEGFSGEGLVLVYDNQVYFIGKESLAQYLVPQAGPSMEVVLAYITALGIKQLDDKKGRVHAAYTPMLHIMEGGG